VRVFGETTKYTTRHLTNLSRSGPRLDHSDYAVGPCRRLTRALEAVAVGSGCHNMSCITTYFMTHELYYRYGIGRLSPSGRVVVLMMGMRRRRAISARSPWGGWGSVRCVVRKRVFPFPFNPLENNCLKSDVPSMGNRTVYLRIHTRLHTPASHTRQLYHGAL